jgi:ABC-type phosphate/phosphonate transport system substrate-binding protein
MSDLKFNYRFWLLSSCTWLILAGGMGSFATAQQAKKVDFLRIGTSGGLALNESGGKEEEAKETLKKFIKDETGFDNEIIPQKDWQELGAKLRSKELNLGVFQGYEFAWAREKHPDLRPLAIAVNIHPYRTAYVVVREDNKAKDYGGLEGQSFALPKVNQGHLRLFVEQETKARGKTPETFFSKITTPENFEDPLDDVVDGMIQAAIVDRVGLEAFKRRKPGRFKRLKEVAHSQTFPPPVVAYIDAALDKDTLQRFQEGLLNAHRKEKGRSLLTFFKLTGFDKAPDDFDRVLTEIRKAYPPPDNTAK